MKLTEWIDTLKIDPEKKKAILASAGTLVAELPELDKEFHEGQLRQSDYSKRLTTLDQQKATLEEDFRKKDQALDAYKNTLVTTGGKMTSTAERAKRQRDAALAKLQEVNAKIQKVAEDNGLDLEELGIDLTLPAATAAPAKGKQAAAAQVDDDDEQKPNYVTAEQLGSELVTYPILVGTIQDAIAEYEDLTGKRVRNSAAMMKEAVELMKSGKQVKLDSFLEEKLGLGTLRTEVETKRRQEEIDLARKDERQKTMSEVMAGNGRANPDFQRNSPVLAFNDKANATKPKGIADTRRTETAARLQERAMEAVKEYQTA